MTEAEDEDIAADVKKLILSFLTAMMKRRTGCSFSAKASIFKHSLLWNQTKNDTKIHPVSLRVADVTLYKKHKDMVQPDCGTTPAGIHGEEPPTLICERTEARFVQYLPG